MSQRPWKEIKNLPCEGHCYPSYHTQQLIDAARRRMMIGAVVFAAIAFGLGYSFGRVATYACALQTAREEASCASR